MKIYLVWDGYVDVIGVYKEKVNAEQRVEAELIDHPNRLRDMYSIIEEVVVDG